MNTEKTLFFMKLGEKLLFSDDKGNINEMLSIDFKIELENNITFDLYDILNTLSKKSLTQLNDKNFSINRTKERYSIKYKEKNTEYKLDDLLIIFFQKMKKKFYDNHETYIRQLIIIYDIDIVSYEIRLIIQQSALINELDVIHMIDVNKTLRYYLELEKTILKLSRNKYVSLIIIYDKKVDICIYTCNPIKKIFEALKEINNLIDKYKDTKDDFILLGNLESNEFIEIKKYISDLIENDMGEQDFQNIEQIYIFNSNKLNKEKLFLGASNSLNFTKTQQCKVIFKVIDLNYQDMNIETEIQIGNYRYNLNKLKKEEIHILLDEELIFEGCFYKTIELTLYKENKENIVLITIYFNQINYYYISLDTKFPNSLELIFFKKFPKISLDMKYYKDIGYDENFEDKEYFKRISLINIDRKKMQNLDFISNDYKEFFSLNEYKDLIVIFGSNLEILSYFEKSKSNIRNKIKNLYESVKFAENFSSELSFDQIKAQKIKLNQMINKLKVKQNSIYYKTNNDLSMWNNIPLLTAYGKY